MASSVEHMEDNLAAADLTLGPSEVRRIESIEEAVLNRCKALEFTVSQTA